MRKVKIRPYLSETRIRADILKYTPLGSSRSNVLEFAQTRLYMGSDPYESGGPAARPVLEQGQHLDRFFGQRWPGPYEDVGVRSVSVDLGDVEFPPVMAIHAYVYWAFDKDDRLIDVIVSKDRDSL